MKNESEKTHESYGMIGVYHSTGGERTLFGSSLTHNNTIHIRIKNGKVFRTCHEDMYMGTKELIDVEMSQAQFAELITSPNHGDGVPCTIRHILGNKMADCPFESKAEIHRQEFEEYQQEIKNKMDELLTFVSSVFDGKAIKKSDREAIMTMLMNLKTDVTSNTSFQVEQFDRQMEQTVTEAKANIEAFLAVRGLSAKSLELPDITKSFVIEITEHYENSTETTTQKLTGFATEQQAIDKAYEMSNNEISMLNQGYFLKNANPFEQCEERVVCSNGQVLDCTVATVFNDDDSYRPVTLYVVKEVHGDIKEE